MGNHFHLVLETPQANLVGQEWKGLRRGWCLGDEAFRKELLEQVDEQAGAFPFGTERTESAKQKAQRIISQQLEKLGWAQKDLMRYRKGDPKKVQIARRLRAETTVTLQWIAERLHMGTGTHVNNRLHHPGSV